MGLAGPLGPLGLGSSWPGSEGAGSSRSGAPKEGRDKPDNTSASAGILYRRASHFDLLTVPLHPGFAWIHQ